MSPMTADELADLQYSVERFGAYVRSLHDCLIIAALNQAATANGKPPVVNAEEINDIRWDNQMHYGEGASGTVTSHWISEKMKLLEEEAKPDGR